jgi:hypothetical protein
LAQNNKHKGLLQFIKRIAEVPLGYSREDLLTFRNTASRDYPSLIPMIDEYVKLAERSATDVVAAPSTPTRSPMASRKEMHLFDMLRERKLFPSNSDLSEFAGSILPGIQRRRFDKMSRGDIAARIIEYLETKDRRTREALEASMREAVTSSPTKPAERQSFLSKWEKIIKGIQL